MRRWILPVLPACAALMTSCATLTERLPAAPRVTMPAEAAKPCSLYRLPAAATQADIEIGYATRGAQIVACDAARALAVQTHEAEHQLEDQITGKARPPAH